MQPINSYAFSKSFEAEKVRPIELQETLRPYSADSKLPVLGTRRSNAQKVAAGRYLREPTIAEKLFSALADVKIWTANVSMYLDRETRDRIFRQLDILHDAEEWLDGDRPVNISSYKSMIRAIVFHDINCRPALSIMPDGNVLALWQDGQDKLTIEFLSDNRARWLVQSHTEIGPERASGQAPLERLREVIGPYGAARWFDGR